MKKRILSLFIVVAMLAAMIVVPAYAVAPNAADYNNTPDTCPCCGKAWSEITWTDMPTGTINSSTWAAADKSHYRLVDNLTLGSAVSRGFGVGYANSDAVTWTATFDLNGYTMNHTGTASSGQVLFEVRNGSTLNVVDTSSNSKGGAVSSAPNGFWNRNSTSSKTKDGKSILNVYGGSFELTKNPATQTYNGGLIRNEDYCELNLYGGIFDASIYNKNNSGGNIYSAGTVVVSNACVIGGAASNGGAIYSTRAINIKDNSYIIGGSASGKGSAVYANNTTLTLNGSVIEGSVYNNGGKVDVKGNLTVSELDMTSSRPAINDCSALTGGEITIVAAADTPFTATLGDPATMATYFKSGVSGLVVDVNADGKLVLTAPVPVEGACPFCGGEAKSWEPWLAETGVSLTEGGHYYLASDQQISNEYTVSSNICLDLNGHDITGTSSGKTLFRVNSGYTLNICDVSDSGESELTGYNNGDGGCFILPGNLNIKGGTNGISLKTTAPQPGVASGNPTTPTGQGGIFRVSGNNSVVNVENCTLTGSDYAHKNGGILHNGGISAKITFTDCTLNGSHVSGNGGAISTATGTITLNNCTVNGGEADGYGGAIAFTANGKLNLNNTTVVDGTAAAIDGFSTAGIYHASYGGNTIDDSTVGSIYTVNNGAWITLVDTVTIANIILDNDTQSSINKKVNTESMSTDSSVGLTVTSDKFGGYGKVSTSGENAEDKVACFQLTDKSDENLVVVARDFDILVEYPGVAAVDAEGKKTWKATADEALALNPEYLLLGSVSAVEVNSDAVIDVNGNDVTISGEAEATLFDSANVNYISYGDVTLNGVTLANEVEYTAPDGNRYIKLENAGAYSFHVLNLRVSAIGLRTVTNGMYYYANYECDDTLKTAISQYGIGYSLYDTDGTSKIVEKTQAVAINSSELALVAFEDIPVGSMNGIVGSDINGYSDSECGQMKIGAQPFVVIDGQVVSGIEVKYSMYDCCAAVDELITELNAGTQAEQTKAAEYVSYMENLFDVVWADYELGWSFTNFNKAS